MAITPAELRQRATEATRAARCADTVRTAADAVRISRVADAAPVAAAADTAYAAATAARAGAAAVRIRTDVVLVAARAAADATYAAATVARAAMNNAADTHEVANNAARTAAIAAHRAATYADLVADCLAERLAVTVSLPPATTRLHGLVRGLGEAAAVRLLDATVAALRGIPETARYAEEWESDLTRLHPGWQWFRWALSLRLRAPRQIRKAAKTRIPTALAPSAELTEKP
jgi:hypothetical protein